MTNKPTHNRENEVRPTPTPWMVREQKGTGNIQIYSEEKAVTLSEPIPFIRSIICTTLNMHDAAFIVRAVNAHEDLVTRLHTAYVDWHFAVGHEPSWAHCKNPQCLLNKQAIANAEGH